MNAFFWLMACLAASLPWFNKRFLGVSVVWKQGVKPLKVELLESLLLYGSVFVSMMFIEARQGALAPQTWQFYVIAVCMWVVLAFPAVAWFKLRKR